MRPERAKKFESFANRAILQTESTSITVPQKPTIEKKKSGLRKRIAKFGVIATFIGASALGTLAATQHKFAEEIKSFPSEAIEWSKTIFDREKDKPSEVFDNSSSSGSITNASIIGENYDQIKDFPLYDEKQKPLLLFPIKQSNENFKVDFTKTTDDLGWPDGNTELAESQGIKDTFDMLSLPEGTEFVAPIDGAMEIFSVVENGEVVPVGLAIEFLSSENIFYRLVLTSQFPVDAPSQKAMDIAPKNFINGNDIEGWKKGDSLIFTEKTEVKRGDHLFNTTREADFKLFLHGGENGVLMPNARVRGNISFFEDAPSEKLIVLK